MPFFLFVFCDKKLKFILREKKFIFFKKRLDKTRRICYNMMRDRCWCGSMAEQLICNQQVDGSTPFTSSIFYGGIPERPKGADCKSVVTDFAGPNPASPTKEKTSPCDWFFSLARIACDPEQALALQVRWSAFERQPSEARFRKAKRKIFAFGAYRLGGILPGEEMAHAISTKSVIPTCSTPSGNTQLPKTAWYQAVIIYHHATWACIFTSCIY